MGKRSRVCLSFAALASLVVSACTMKSQEAPPLTGPSGLATSIELTATPGILSQDGASQAVVVVTARDANGQPIRNLALRAEILSDGVRADFGTLSARNIVTGADGRATLVYTAPAAPPVAVDNGTIIEIAVTPVTGNFANEVSRSVQVRLVPPGIVVPPDGLTPAFTVTPSQPADHQSVFFDASNSTAPANNPIATYEWEFGDGDSGSGKTTTHAYDNPGTYFPKLTVKDALGRSASTTVAITVVAGTAPAVTFTVSPSAPVPGQQVNFNASATRPAPGRTIRTYNWDFGDGEQKTTTTPHTTHDYQTSGTYTVTLMVTDDAGRTATGTQTVTIASDSPRADFTFSPTTPGVGTPVNFNPAGSSAVAGRTITAYFWTFGDGSSSSAASPAHPYAAPGSYNVTLTVTDSQGKTGTVTKTVTVS
ncbi:MAG: PKD domain-containing protein [Acidobacteria bacterium]|nr:PKD domain-containing protein [Acidobacteriota bacterium]